MLLKHLEKKGDPTCEEHGKVTIGGSDGETKGHIVFAKYENVDVSASYFENGAFLTIGHVGCHSEVSVSILIQNKLCRKLHTTVLYRLGRAIAALDVAHVDGYYSL